MLTSWYQDMYLCFQDLIQAVLWALIVSRINFILREDLLVAAVFKTKRFIYVEEKKL